MPPIRTLLLVLFASALAGFVLHQSIPYARACMAPLDTGATFDLTRSSINENSGTGASVAEEEAFWTETATISLPDHRIELSDGSAVVYQ